MSHSLPSISHRLFVAAAGQGRPPQPKARRRAAAALSRSGPAKPLELEVVPEHDWDRQPGQVAPGKMLVLAPS